MNRAGLQRRLAGSAVRARSLTWPTVAIACCAWLGAPPASAAGIVLTLEPAGDNSIYEAPPGVPELLTSNGAGDFLFSGRGGLDAGFRLRRALLRFDLSPIPAGSIIVGAELTLHQSRAGPSTVAESVGLHLVRREWGEGTSDGIGPEGQGAPPTHGDATWLHSRYPDTFWTGPGGDYVAEPSTSVTIGANPGHYSWTCTEQLLRDLGFWLDHPEENHGWIVIGTEALAYSARRFDSREHPVAGQRPKLRIVYLLPGTVSADGFEELSCG